MVRLWICALSVVVAGCQLPHDFGCDAGGQCGPGAYCGSDSLCHAGSTGTLGSTSSAATTVGTSGSTTVMGVSTGASLSTSGQAGMGSTGVASSATTGGSSGIASGGAEAGASGTTSSKPGATSGSAAGSAVGSAAGSTTGGAVGSAVGSTTGSTTGGTTGSATAPPACPANLLAADGGVAGVAFSGRGCVLGETFTGVAVAADGAVWVTGLAGLYLSQATDFAPPIAFSGRTADSLSSWPDSGLLFGDFDAGSIYLWDGGVPQLVLTGLAAYDMRPSDVLHTAQLAAGKTPGFYVASRARPALSQLPDGTTDPDELTSPCPAGVGCFDAGCIQSLGQLDLDSANDLFVTDPVCNAIGELVPKAPGMPPVVAYAGANGVGCDEHAGVATFNGPTGIAVDRATCTVYVADNGNRAIRSIGTSGNVMVVMVTDYDGGIAAAGFMAPKLLAFVPPNTLYDADESGCLVELQLQ